MIKFEEHDGKLFKMLDKPVPLKEKDTNVLVQFITHGIIGEYVIEHCLDCNQKNVPIFVDSVDSDGDVTGYIENGNEYICCPFPMFEIIGYPVSDGSNEWALYQMMQGKKVIRKYTIGNVCWALNQDGDVQFYDMDDLAYIGTIRSKLEFGKNHAFKTVWQLYKEPKQQKPETLFDTWQCPVCGESISAEFEDSGHPRYNEEHLDENLCFAIGDHMKYSHTVEQPKPLLADTGIGDIVKTNLGDWLQIVDIPCLRFGHDECYRTHDGLYWDEYGVCDVDSTYRLVAVEPLAPEGTAEWAWQMLKLQKPVSHPAEGELQDTDYTKEGFVRCMAKTGWQLYEPKPQPDKEDMHLRSGKDNPERQDICHMYEPQPEPQYKVGDWVEWRGDQYMVKSAPPQSGDRYDIRSPYDELGWSVCPENITRKLSPADIVIRIGCLSGTIAKSSDPNYFLMLHSRPLTDCNYSMIRFTAIDTETRELVESLLKAQEEETK